MDEITHQQRLSSKLHAITLLTVSGINEDFTMYYDCEIEGRPAHKRLYVTKVDYLMESVYLVILVMRFVMADNDCDDEMMNTIERLRRMWTTPTRYLRWTGQ